MRAQYVKSKVGVGSRPCRHCGGAIKAGQWVLRQRLPNNPITDREIVYHASCMRTLLDKCGADRDLGAESAKQGYQNLRDKILTTGNIFPDD